LLELEHAEQASNRDALAARTLALRARASSLQIELRDAKERAQRQQRLFETGAVSANDAKSQTARAKSLASSAEAANADVRASQAELAALDTRIAERRIVAPTDGTLLNEPPHVGELFGGPGRMLELADFATLAIETEIPEAQLASVALGAPCEISLDALPTRQFRGEVSSIDPQVNRAKATIGLEVGFVGNTAGVLPNMAARVNFVRANAPTEPSKPRVAESAVLRLDARSYVFSVDEQDRLHRVEVELGATERGKVELLRGPPAGSAVVDHPSPALHDGQRVRYGE
jgi:RND family efflux transporter MFP subunit